MNRPPSGATGTKRGLRYLAIWAVVAVLPMAAVALVNYAVDPFQFFRVSDPPRFSNSMQRYQHPGVIRNYPFSSLVAGNSLVGNLQTDMFDRREFGTGRVQNLSFWGSTLREAAYVVDFSVRTKPIDTVYWAIGRQAILLDYRYGEFPTCMYSRLWSHFPYCYLLNADIFLESLAIAFNRKGLSDAGWVSSLDEWKAIPFRPRDRQTLACEMQRGVRGDDVAALTRIARENLNPIEGPEIRRFREIVLPIVQANRQVRFKFLFTPFQLWQFWFNAAKRDGRALKTELAMIDALINEPNVEIHDMTGMVWFTHNPDRYDYMHYDLAGAREVVDALAAGSMKVTSMARHRDMLLNEIQAGGDMVRETVEEFKTRCP
jgi:hypothetical protein